MRRNVLTLIAIGCAGLGSLAVPSVAAAHDPIILDDAQTTPDAGPLLLDGTVSFALYGVVAGADDARGFRVRMKDGDQFIMSLLIPDLAPENALAPDELPVVRLDRPDGTTSDLSPDMSVPFDEPFSGTRYIRLLDLAEPAVAGDYGITISGAQPARFTVSVGTIEQFGTAVEGATNRDLGVAGVLDWYATAPPEPVTPTVAPTEPPAPPATDAESTTTTEDPDSTMVALEGGDDSASDDTAGNSVFIPVVTVVVALVAISIAVRRRRRT